MKLNVLALALAATAFGTLAAQAQTTVIEERRDPAVVIEHSKPADSTTTIEKREGLFGEKKTITKETTGSGDCDRKTVHREGIGGSTTVEKTNCD
jgi:hypothetical protein